NPERYYELVSTLTPDGVKLQGIFQKEREKKRVALDAAIVLHGLGGNFYGSSLNLGLADALGSLGIAVALINTRGHDNISMSRIAGRAETLGAAYEIVDDCRHDVAGWLDWIHQRGYKNVCLIGHSLGAIKALYAAATLQDADIKAIVGLSATRLCHDAFLQSERGADFRKWMKIASKEVELGNERKLIHVDFPFPTHMAAGAYRDKYGPEDRYDWTRYVDLISVPALLIFGERELQDNAAFHGLREKACEICETSDSFSMTVIESANHFYAGVQQRATDAMKDWIQEKF
ncbi:MAG: alpha/beta fold hydrolase, partial [Pirellulaceae bacterium]|nr:alpha/beta fold hydrolase [Pirellulaceae bacterium]